MHSQLLNIQPLLEQFNSVHGQLLKVMENLAHVEDPVLSVAVQDLSQATNLLQLLQNDVASSLHMGKDQLSALVGVGHVINSALGLDFVLNQVMDTIIELMKAERGFLVLTDQSGVPSLQAARGMEQTSLLGSEFSVSSTILQRVITTGEPVLTTNAQEDPRFENQNSVIIHNLRSILCVPLKLKREIIGAIFVDNRAYTGIFQTTDLDILSAFADQAAVAIDNARLFDKLQDANDELKNAYDATLNGWAMALDLRDRETEGHTQRVTALTLILAKKLGIKDENLEHIKRGAMLHDIGKMAIPDGILLKPGKLTLTERKFMELHPIFAYEMLHPIEFLRPAIDIPYCHHEKWDGSGYPRNLKGGEIPFAARIFSVVDVWDALTSDRPYRGPVEPDEVRKHIVGLTGTQFDPLVVDAFMNLDDLPVANLGKVEVEAAVKH